MVLCKYFQQGNCRYGSRCTNEHFDVKQIIKTDVDAAINGKQWPLSCYGPFKDKPSIPNFIEDQSFEEIRYLCYESKQRNFFQQFHQQFTKEVLEAKNKLKALQQLTPEVVNVVTDLYDKPLVRSNNSSVKSNNPYSFNSGQADSGPFGKPVTQTTTSAFGGRSFGSGGANVNTGNIFANNNNNSNNPASSGSPFGSTTTTSPFAKVPNNQQNSIFGQQPTANQPTTSATIFGTAPNQQQTGFNQSIQAHNAVGGIFGQTANPSQVPPTTGLFSQATQQTPSVGLFSQAAQQTASAFTQQQTQPNVFGRALQTQPTHANIFTQQQQFQQSNAAAGTGLFAAAAAQTQTMFQQQQQQTTSIFAQAQTQNALTGFAQQPSNGPFMQSTQAMNSSGNASGADISYGSVYSRLEDLTPEEIEAFKADHFSEGKIPFSPPPREHIN